MAAFLSASSGGLIATTTTNNNDYEEEVDEAVSKIFARKKNMCVVCDAPALFHCSGCIKSNSNNSEADEEEASTSTTTMTVYYCCKDHQRLHWGTGHKALCGQQPNNNNKEYKDPAPLCDLCQKNHCDYFDNEELNNNNEKKKLLSPVQAAQATLACVCTGCGALYCADCATQEIFGDDESTCCYCGALCPKCSQSFGGSCLTHHSSQQKQHDSMRQLQALADHSSADEHKNQSWWNLMLGEYYRDNAEKRNIKAAIRCYLIAGNKDGISKAFCNAGALYGSDELHDYAKAAHYYKLAAASTNTTTSSTRTTTKPDAVAAHNLGCMYSAEKYNGGAFPLDYKVALEWFEKAVELGHRYSCNGIGTIYLEGNNPAQVPQNKKLAVKWYRRGAEGGVRTCMYRLARRYRDGDGVAARDYDLSRKWYQLAAEKGCVGSMYHMGQFYLNGWGVPEDQQQAREWFQRAADKGDEYALEALRMLNLGIPVYTRLPS